MKTIFYDGVALVTDDRVADAVVDLALALARYRQYETTTIPVVVDGRREQLTLILGPTIHLSALTVPDYPYAAEGSVDVDCVVERLQARTRTVTEPMRPIEDEIGEWLDGQQ